MTPLRSRAVAGIWVTRKRSTFTGDVVFGDVEGGEFDGVVVEDVLR